MTIETHALRSKALDAKKVVINAERDATIKKARSAIDAAGIAAEQAARMADHAFTAENARLEGELAAEVIPALTEIFTRFPKEPRESSVELGQCWRTFSQRAREELGEALSGSLLAHGMAAAGGLADRVGGPNFMLHDGLHRSPQIAGVLSNVILQNRHASSVEAQTRALEIAVNAEAPLEYAEPERAAALRSMCTDRGMRVSVVSHDAEVARARAEADTALVDQGMREKRARDFGLHRGAEVVVAAVKSVFGIEVG